MRILLTGATGFAGGAILRHVLAAGFDVRAPVRRSLPAHPRLETPSIDDLTTADWPRLCQGVDAVIHAAAYAHDDRADPAMILRINCEATAALAEAAGAVGARFIFLSSIRAQAGVSSPFALREGDQPQPDGPYGEAKLSAERAVAAACPDHANLRLAPLYGPGLKGNLATLFRLAKSPWPLPLAGFHAARSLLAVETLAALIVRLLGDGRDLRGTYLVAEPEPLSLAQMIGTIRMADQKPTRLWPLAPALVEAICRTANKPLLWRRIGEPLVVAEGLRLQRRFPDLFQPTREGLKAWARAETVSEPEFPA